MIDHEAELNLQAFLDGELPEGEARKVAAWLARDAEATALSTELRNTRRALAGFETNPELPETREFYWSKIEREIRRLEPMETPVRTVSFLARLRRVLVPVCTGVALAIAVLVASMQFGLFQPKNRPETEMVAADAGTFTYYDYANGTTLVWVSYPAESEFANNPSH
jgi:anti-sigma factor RsiW